MSTLAARRCVQHPVREAVGRCNSCGHDFCRECVVEHDGVIWCAPCLAKHIRSQQSASRSFVTAASEFAISAACLLLLWILFYGFGQFLKTIPPDVHEGTVWRMGDP